MSMNSSSSAGTHRQNRVTSRPERREVSPDARDTAGEDTGAALAESPHGGTDSEPAREGGSDGGSLETACEESPDSVREIVRALGKVEISPRLLAEHPEAHRRGECGKAEFCSACRFFAVADEARRQVAYASNALVREYWRVDGAALDALSRELGRPPHGREELARWPRPKFNSYQLVRVAAPALSGGIASAVAKAVTDKWMQTRFDTLLRQIKSPPHYKADCPIPVRAQELGAVARLGGGRYSVSFSVGPSAPGRKGKEFKVPVEARDGYQRRILDELSEPGSVKVGAAQISQHRTKRGKWFISFTYTKRVRRSTGTVEAAINRGMVCFLACATNDGKSWLYDACDIESHLRRIKSRRREIQRDVVGSGRVGRGRTRALRAIEILEARGERWRATKCQTVARRLVRWLADQGVGRLYLEDLSGIRDADAEMLDGGKAVWDRIQEWPYYRLGTCIKSCAEELGIEVSEVAAQYISRRCPQCGNVDRERRGAAPRVLRCSQCRFSRHIDVVAATNLLARARGTWVDEPSLADGVAGGGRRRRNPGRRGNG